MADLIERKDALDCLDSRDFDSYEDYSRTFDAIEDIPSPSTAGYRWIPCSERMPENGERVLVRFRSGTVHIAVWYGDYDEKGTWEVTSQFPTKLYRTDTIPKWMPMPDAYEPPEVTQDE